MHHQAQDNNDSLSPPPQPQQPQHQHHHQQHQHQHQHAHRQQPIRQCPYWSDRPLPGFAPHFSPGLAAHPPRRNHPTNPPHSHLGPQGSHSQHVQHPGAGLATPDDRSQASHPYDPVHSSIPALNSTWYPGTPSYHWSPVTLPHPRPSFDSFWQYPNMNSSTNNDNPGGVGVGPESAEGAGTPLGGTNDDGNVGNNNSSSNSRGAVAGSDTTSSSRPVQPPVVQNQQTLRHEPFTPFSPLAFHQQPASLHRFNAMPAPSQNQQSGQQTGQQPPPPSFTSSSTEFPAIRLPALGSTVLPRPTQLSPPRQQPQQNAASTAGHNNMPGSGDPYAAPNPVVTSGSAARTTRALPEPTLSTRVPSMASSRNPGTPPRTNADTFDRDRHNYFGSAATNTSLQNTRRLLSNMRSTHASGRRSDSSDYDSEEDAADEQERMGFLRDSLGANLSRDELTEARIRAQQLLRGQMSTKRVASKSAIASLRSVDIASLPEKDRSTYSHPPPICLIQSNNCLGQVNANVLLRSVHHLLQRLRRREPGRHQRGTTPSTQVQARLRGPLHQEMVRGVGQLSLLP